MKNKYIDGYLIPHLREYGNVFASSQSVKKQGGIKVLLKELKARNYVCEYDELTEVLTKIKEIKNV